MEDLLPKTGYRARIERAVKLDRSHPINNGVKMQAHHLVSAKGVQLANMGKKLEALGYDINVLENLVLLPCTLEGACHLRVQLHRGDHTYDDDDHPMAYHLLVQSYLKQIRSFLDDCSGCQSSIDQSKTGEKVQKKVDGIAKKILNDISRFKVPLTKIHKSFHPDSKIGCGNVDSISKHGGDVCVHERNHDSSTISFPSHKQWTLKAGK